jgi:hypothetical protein
LSIDSFFTTFRNWKINGASDTLVEVTKSAKPERVEIYVQVGDDNCNTTAISRIKILR